MEKRIFRFLPFMTPIILNPWIGCILRSFPSKRRMRSERWRAGRSLRVRSSRLQLQRSLSLLSIQIYPSKLPNLSRPSLLERPSLSLHLPRCLYLQQRSSLLHMSLLKLIKQQYWMNLFEKISSLGTQIEKLVLISDHQFYSIEDHMDRY